MGVQAESRILYLAYFDDSGSDRNSDLCVFGGVVIPGDEFGFAESWVTEIVRRLEMGDSFVEFKAGELYFGNGQFEGKDKTLCRKAFTALMEMMAKNKLPFIYSAVDKRALNSERLLGSAHPVDVAFRMCLGALEMWARKDHWSAEGGHWMKWQDMCLVIADECDPSIKRQMLETFRAKRRRHPLLVNEKNEVRESLFHIHDSMYFGQSSQSIGLQVADAANWAMHRLLRGAELDERIAELLKSAAICAAPEPEWTQYRHLFRSHADDAAV